MQKTILSKWHDIQGENELYPVYTRDSWELPEDGAMLHCPCFTKINIIRPYGDGCHVYVGTTVYHKDEILGILEKRHTGNGCSWSIEGVSMTREQYINGQWKKVDP